MSPCRPGVSVATEVAMPEGVIAGGWNYVIAAYSLTGVIFAAYAVSLRVRWAKAVKDEESDR